MATQSESINTSLLINLCRCDPPKWGWGATGGVIDLLPPIERARRHQSKEYFLKYNEIANKQKVLKNEEGKNDSTKELSGQAECEGQDKRNESVQDKSPTKSKTLPDTASNSVPGEENKSQDSVQNETENKAMSKSECTSDEKENHSKELHLSTSKSDFRELLEKLPEETEVLELYSYHRGRVGEELRDESTGELLCDVEDQDTNYYWDPSLKPLIHVKFPLSDPDDEKAEHKDGTSKKENIVEYHETIEWDLQDRTGPCPILFASKMAEEYGLSYGQTLDLSGSIQKQIDDFLKKSKYQPPITILDPFGLKRPTSVKRGVSTPRHNNRSSHNGPAKPPSAKPRSWNKGRGHIYQSRKEDRDEVLSRSKNEFCIKYDELAKKKSNDEPRFPMFVTNRFCHICHAKKPEGLAFRCEINQHVYCNYHCETRLGYSCRELSDQPDLVKYCPVCTLVCACSKCSRRLDLVADDFQYQCKEQNVNEMAECKYDTLNACTYVKKIEPRLNPKIQPTNEKRAVAKHDVKLTTTSRRRSETTNKPPRAKLQSNSSRQTRNHVQKNTKLNKLSSHFKVPISAFPFETFEGKDLDPAEKDEYRTIFGPQGVLNIDTDHESTHKPVGCGDGNINYCIICDKGGKLTCCDNCPRSFHKKCLNRRSFPDYWICHICFQDKNVSDEDKLDASGSIESIIPSFSFMDDAPLDPPNVQTVAKIHQMLVKLIASDFGYIFQEPIDVKTYSDYLSVVRNPMDLGSIIKNLINGVYVNKPQYKDGTKQSGEIFEEVVLNILIDIELVWHNCFKYNSDGSCCHRMGKVQRQKFLNYKKCSVDPDISHETKIKLKEKVVQFEKERKDYFTKYFKSEYVQSDNTYCHTIEANNGRVGSGRAVAVYDPDTGKVLKLYSRLKAAVQAMTYINKKFSSEHGTISENACKSLVRRCTEDSTLRCFGYRWVYFDDLKAGGIINFESTPPSSKASRSSNTILNISFDDDDATDESLSNKSEICSTRKKVKTINELPSTGINSSNQSTSFVHNELQSQIPENAIICMEDLVSGAILQYYETVEDAFQSWKENLTSVYCPVNCSDTIIDFQTYFLDGERNIDGLQWSWLQRSSTLSVIDENTKGLEKNDQPISTTDKENEIKNNFQKNKIETRMQDTTNSDLNPNDFNRLLGEQTKQINSMDISNENKHSNAFSNQKKRKNFPFMYSKEKEGSQSFEKLQKVKSSVISNDFIPENTSDLHAEQNLSNDEAHKRMMLKISMNEMVSQAEDNTNSSSKGPFFSPNNTMFQQNHKIVAIEMNTLEILKKFHTMQEASVYAKIPESELRLKMNMKSTVNGVIFAYEHESTETIKTIQNAVSTFIKSANS